MQSLLSVELFRFWWFRHCLPVLIVTEGLVIAGRMVEETVITCTVLVSALSVVGTVGGLEIVTPDAVVAIGLM